MPSKKLQALYSVLPENIKERVSQEVIEDYIMGKKELPFVLQQLLESKVRGHTFVFAFTTMHAEAQKNDCKSIDELDNLD